jgi:hypothetical protein
MIEHPISDPELARVRLRFAENRRIHEAIAIARESLIEKFKNISYRTDKPAAEIDRTITDRVRWLLRFHYDVVDRYDENHPTRKAERKEARKQLQPLLKALNNLYDSPLNDEAIGVLEEVKLLYPDDPARSHLLRIITDIDRLLGGKSSAGAPSGVRNIGARGVAHIVVELLADITAKPPTTQTKDGKKTGAPIDLLQQVYSILGYPPETSAVSQLNAVLYPSKHKQKNTPA